MFWLIKVGEGVIALPDFYIWIMDFKNRSYMKDRVEFDLSKCFYCGKKFNPWEHKTVDHILPKSKEGILSKKNKAPSCQSCNSLKGEMEPESFLLALESIQRFEKDQAKRREHYISKVIRNVKQLIEWKD